MKNIPVRKISISPKEPVFSGSFVIRDIRDLLAGKDMVQDLHRHDFFYMLALKKGKGKHQIDFTSYKVGDHTIFIMRPGQVHQLTLKAGSTGYLLQFKTGFPYPYDKASGQLLRKAGNTNFYQPGPAGFKKLLPVLTAVFKEYTGKQEGYGEAIKANLGIFFIELARLHSPGRPGTAGAYTDERLQDFLALVETHITTHKQVSEYAGMLNLSPYQLNAITKTTLGKTASALINEYIILESKRQLLATSAQVKEIAWGLGYEDASYFTRFFKKQTGHSPESFRQHYS